MTDPKPFKIAVASGKGGTGKTLVSTNMFYALQQLDYKVTLVDCDAEEPDVLVFINAEYKNTFSVTQKVPVIDESKCTFCGKCHEYCSYNAIFTLPPAEIIKVIEDLCHGCGACSFACNYEAISEKDESLGTVSQYSVSAKAGVTEARMKVGVYSPVLVIKAAIREAVKVSGKSGIIILDSPPGTSCPFIQTVAGADYVILVTEPTPFGVSDLRQSVETLKTLQKSFGVIVNRAGLGDAEIYEYLQQENIALLMEIPFDKAIASQYSKGELVAKSNPLWQAELTRMFHSIH